jgi:hypothetical protein
VAGFVISGCAACEVAKQPPYSHTAELVGAPYERGFQHGDRFSSEVRSLYTKLVTTSIVPYINRERSNIAEVLYEYQDPRYDDGQFAYLIFEESGYNLETWMPQGYIDEMQGIADGAGLEYRQILTLNTFFDTLMAFRAMSFFLAGLKAPKVARVEFTGVGGDGADNDGDGIADEPGEGLIEPFDPCPYASMVEVPVDTTVRIFLEAPAGVDPARIRIQRPDRVFTIEDPEVQTSVYGESDEGLEVTFTPTGGFAPASYHALIVSAGDTLWDEDPPPGKANMMRDMRLGFTTEGDGRSPGEVPNSSFDDGRSQPPAFAFALRGSATVDGNPLLAQHFSLLDSNASHQHNVVFLHRPDVGRPHMVVGWTGAIFGFSGMNDEGLSFAVNYSDTLDNPLAAEFRDQLIFAKMISSGVSISILGRELLSQAGDTEEAVAWLREQPYTFGWNFLLADARGDIRMVEVDSNIAGDATSFHAYGPESRDASHLDPWGNPLSSVGNDDLSMGVHFRANREDIHLDLLGFAIRSQRTWSTYYYRTIRSYHLLSALILDGYGSFDAPAAQVLLSYEPLVDQRDSMNAVVYEPARMMLHVASGQVPATDGPFRTIDLGAWLAGEAPSW